MLKIVLSLDVFNEKKNQALLSQLGEFKQIPIYFNDILDYRQYFEPLLIEEVTQEIKFQKSAYCSIMEEAISEQIKKNDKVQEFSSNKFSFLSLNDEVQKKEIVFLPFNTTFQADDLILCVQDSGTFYNSLSHCKQAVIQQRSLYFLGIIVKEKILDKNGQNKVGNKLLVKIIKSKLEKIQDLQNQAVKGSKIKFYVYKLMPLTTGLREFKSLALTEFSPLFKKIIQPGRHPSCEFPVRIPPSFMQILKNQLNSSQFEAIEKILSKYEGITLLQGPPGTGKTFTIIALLSAFLLSNPISTSKPYVLVCAPSNCAVNEIACRAVRTGILGEQGKRRNDIKMVRVGAWFREQQKNNDYQEEALSITLQNIVAQRFKQEFGIDIEQTKKQMDQIDQQIDKLAKKFKKLKNNEKEQLEQLKIQKRKLSQQIYDEKLGRNHLKDKKSQIEMEILNSADVVFSTLSGSACNDILQKISHNFDYVIIDEACQSVELSSLIPFQYNGTHIVLVGDPQQLPATVFSQQGSQFGYCKSLFQRLMEAGEETIMLKIQYRMESNIRQFPSDYFYKGFLQDAPSIFTRSKPQYLQNIYKNLVLFDISYGQETYTENETSSFNDQEAQ